MQAGARQWPRGVAVLTPPFLPVCFGGHAGWSPTVALRCSCPYTTFLTCLFWRPCRLEPNCSPAVWLSLHHLSYLFVLEATQAGARLWPCSVAVLTPPFLPAYLFVLEAMPAGAGQHGRGNCAGAQLGTSCVTGSSSGAGSSMVLDPQPGGLRPSTRSRSVADLGSGEARFPLLFPPCMLMSFGGCFKQPRPTADDIQMRQYRCPEVLLGVR
jgi:hypothetical protein